MEKRVLLAAGLSLVFLFLWQYFFYKPHSDNKQNVEEKLETKTKGDLISSDLLFEPYTLETKYLKFVFNKYTAGIREVYIKEDYKDDFILLCKEDKDILTANLTDKYDVLTTYQNEEVSVKFYSKKEKVSFTYYINNNSPYFVLYEIKTPTPKILNIAFESYVQSDEPVVEPNTVHICKLQDTSKKEILTVEKIDKGKFYEDDKIKWLAVSSRYFMAALIFDKNYLENEISITKVNKKTKNVTIVTKPLLNYNMKLFFGPKKVSLLRATPEKLFHTIDWGTFAPLSKLFYNILTFLYNIFKNYGLAIIGLTIIIQIFTLPLTYNSIKATVKMRQIQPQVQLLQKIYKDDPKRLNIEIMNLYKEKKVNPFGGCLPLILQIPIFWALFTMLRNTYDLRGASFILWIKDLSQPDKLVIPGLNFGIPVLVILMGVSMFVQQLISGTFSDPQQRTIGIIMPIIFVFLFFGFPSGLVLYWFINNLFSIGLQFLITQSTKS
ncbi:MAG: membrane protein insertase YidC [Endomicrobia bacterium]|nr:membrane protein insertase YidC [Endomicrobiia bacterium]